MTDITFVGGLIGIQHNGSDESTFSIFEDCFVVNSGTAVSISGGLGSLLLVQVSITGLTGQNAIIINKMDR